MTQLTGTKPAIRSLGVWGGAVATVAGGAGLLGYTVSAEEASALGQQADAVAAAVSQAVLLVSSLASAVGGIIAIIGRVRARARIGAAAAEDVEGP